MRKFIFLSLAALALTVGATAQTKSDPYAGLPKGKTFQVSSPDLSNGGPFKAAQMSGIFGVTGGMDVSPALSWGEPPAGTKSFVVSMYDPDAPTASGFWHWMVVDIPAKVRQLPAGAGSPDGKLLPQGAWQVLNDASMAQYVGAAPPPGHGPHRYYIVVTALDVETLGLQKNATPSLAMFNMWGHTLGRAVMVPVAERK